MNMDKWIKVLFLYSVLSLVSQEVYALEDEIQVYDDTINAKGIWGVEMHTNTTLGGPPVTPNPGELANLHQLRNTYELSYGIDGHFEAGLYLPFVHEAQGPIEFAGPRVRMKWIGKAAPQGGSFYGFNVELSDVKYQFEAQQQAIELRPIMGLRNPDWLIAFNPVFDYTTRPGFRQQGPIFSPQLKVARTVAQGLQMGFEFYGDVGPVVQPYYLYQQGNTLFAAIDIDRGPWIVNAAVGRGFNSFADGWTIKTIIEIPHNWFQ
ncbi:hypothetical protein FERRO_12350 [Ferrovum sp. JA12]|uniref:hypothetical protein n=1 Tax=Ferrovum sp. JA12 TaxID=1356299 RepID=UPI00070353C0|nr:hypothetical protein [Ferrovum sp. JA12]KRH78254.1 hypothetical protein FERRO_12350 [Ferrovum sp. JA12]